MVVQLAVIDAAGRLVFTTLGPADGTLSLADRPHFRVHLKRSEDILFISVPVLGCVSGR
ncbi:hypothetical protein ACFQX4_11675 [Roseomonas sp. GCM10028921]